MGPDAVVEFLKPLLGRNGVSLAWLDGDTKITLVPPGNTLTDVAARDDGWIGVASLDADGLRTACLLDPERICAIGRAETDKAKSGHYL